MPSALERHRLNVRPHRLDHLSRQQTGNSPFGFKFGVVDDDMGMKDSLFALGLSCLVVIVVGNRHFEAADALSFWSTRVKPFGRPLVHKVSEVIELYAVVLLV